MTQGELFNDEAKAHAGKILAVLQAGRALTKLEILRDIGCLNGGGRIFDLRHGKFDGNKYPIQMRKVEVETRTGKSKVAQYYMENGNDT
jgi:hypothetical protein